MPPTSQYTLSTFAYARNGQTALSMDLYLPSAARKTSWPVFLIFNGFGGSFMRGSPQSQGWAKAGVAHGFAAITAETTPDHVADDFDSLTDYLNRNAQDLHIDADRIAVIAWSGNVPAALTVLQDARRTAVKAAIIYYGAGRGFQARLDLPMLIVRAGLDQPELNHDLDDLIVSGIRANAPWTVVNYPAGQHGFDVFNDDAMSREIIEETFRFAQWALSDSQQAALHSGLSEASAASAMATGDFLKAAALYRPIAMAHPGNSRLLLAYGNALLRARQYKEARTQFDRAKTIGGLGARDLGIPAAKACALDNDAEGAIAWLKTIPKQFLPASIRSDPDFATIKERADFQALFP